MNKLYTITIHPYTYYTDELGAGWNINNTKFSLEQSLRRHRGLKKYYIFINLYPTHA